MTDHKRRIYEELLDSIYPTQSSRRADPCVHITSMYALNIITKTPKDFNSVLCVKETKNRGWWIPGGGIKPGETLVQAARRECLEEAGVDVKYLGVIRLHYAPHEVGFSMMHVVLHGVPVDGAHAKLKNTPDSESEGAEWLSMSDMSTVRLRGGEPVHYLEFLQNGGVVSPMSVIDDDLTRYQ